MAVDVRRVTSAPSAELLHAQKPVVPAHFPRRQQEAHPPEPRRLADNRPRIPVGGYAFDAYGVEVDAGEAQLVAGRRDPVR